MTPVGPAVHEASRGLHRGQFLSAISAMLGFMLGTSARLLRLLTVLQTKRSWSGDGLAGRLEVTGRTLRRDIDRLRSLGYAIDATSGPGGGYQLGKGNNVPPLQLDDEEAVAVAVALRAAADMFVGLSETALGVLTKLDQTLPARVRRRLGALQVATVSVAGSGAKIDAEMLTKLAAACRDSERVSFAYADRGGVQSERNVEPHRIAYVGNRRFYLVAWDLGRGDWRTFRVDRIERILSVGPRVPPREPPADLEKYVAESISHSAYKLRAKLRLFGSPATLAKVVPPWCGVLEPLGDDGALLSTGADSVAGLVCQLVMIGVDFEILEPKSVLPEVRAVVARLARATAKPAEAVEHPRR